MLKISGSEMSFSEKIRNVIVVGSFFAVEHIDGKHYYFNLNDISAYRKTMKKFGINEWFDHFQKTTLKESNQWGVDEKDYDIAADSPNHVVRGLAAKNGVQLERLSSDDCEDVRYMVVESLVERRERGEKLTGIGYLDKLVDDQSILVRLILARLGIQSHLKKLVLDDEPLVAIEAVRLCNTKTLDSIVKTKDIYMRVAASNNPNATVDQVSELMGGRFKLDLDNLIKSGVVDSDITGHNHILVRRSLAQHGHVSDITFLETDADAGVREWLAVRGISTERFLMDSNERVRLAAQSCALSGIKCK